MIVRGKHWRTGQSTDVVIEQDAVVDVRSATAEPATIAANWVVPGFFDLQVNGCLGIGFNSEKLTVEDVSRAVRHVAGHGTTGMLPTLVTGPVLAWQHALKTLVKAIECDRFVASRIPGIHLEGPSISPVDGPRGAHPKEHVRPPSWNEFQRHQEAALGRVRLVTLAPEYDEALPYIEKLVAAGVRVAIGHTQASGERIRAAVSAGASLSTHLGNGCAALLPRHNNALWEQMANDGLWASVISDGHHLPAALLKTILRVKTTTRALLISDCSSLAGLPPGRYMEWGRELEVTSNGRVNVPDTDYLAGSGAFLDRCVGFAAVAGGINLAQAIELASVRPREYLGLPIGDVLPGTPSGIVAFDLHEGGELQCKFTCV